MRVEVQDKNSGAILFKKTKSSKKIDELKNKVNELEKRIKSLEKKIKESGSSK